MNYRKIKQYEDKLNTTANIKQSWDRGFREFSTLTQSILYLDTKTLQMPLQFHIGNTLGVIILRHTLKLKKYG